MKSLCSTIRTPATVDPPENDDDDPPPARADSTPTCGRGGITKQKRRNAGPRRLTTVLQDTNAEWSEVRSALKARGGGHNCTNLGIVRAALERSAVPPPFGSVYKGEMDGGNDNGNDNGNGNDNDNDNDNGNGNGNNDGQQQQRPGRRTGGGGILKIIKGSSVEGDVSDADNYNHNKSCDNGSYGGSSKNTNDFNSSINMMDFGIDADQCYPPTVHTPNLAPDGDKDNKDDSSSNFGDSLASIDGFVGWGHNSNDSSTSDLVDSAGFLHWDNTHQRGGNETGSKATTLRRLSSLAEDESLSPTNDPADHPRPRFVPPATTKFEPTSDDEINWDSLSSLAGDESTGSSETVAQPVHEKQKNYEGKSVEDPHCRSFHIEDYDDEDYDDDEYDDEPLPKISAVYRSRDVLWDSGGATLKTLTNFGDRMLRGSVQSEGGAANLRNVKKWGSVQNIGNNNKYSGDDNASEGGGVNLRNVTKTLLDIRQESIGGGKGEGEGEGQSINGKKETTPTTGTGSTAHLIKLGARLIASSMTSNNSNNDQDSADLDRDRPLIRRKSDADDEDGDAVDIYALRRNLVDGSAAKEASTGGRKGPGSLFSGLTNSTTSEPLNDGGGTRRGRTLAGSMFGGLNSSFASDPHNGT